MFAGLRERGGMKGTFTSFEKKSSISSFLEDKERIKGLPEREEKI